MQLQLSTTLQVHDDPIVKKLEQELILFAQVEGRQQALLDKPENMSEFKARFLNKVQASIQEGIFTVQKTVKPIAAAVVVKEIKEEEECKKEPLKGLVRELEHEKKKHELEKKQNVPNLKKQTIQKIVFSAAGFIAATEAVLAYEAIRIAGLSKIAALVTSTGIGVAIGFGTHYMARWIKHSSNVRQSIIRYALVLIAAFIGFWVLGHMRANGYAVTNTINLHLGTKTTTHPVISGATLSIISFLLFLVGLLFSVRYAKSKAEEENDGKYDTACIQEAACEKKIVALKTQIQAIEQNCTKDCEQCYLRFEHAYSTEQQLICLSDKIVSEFITTNLRHRKESSVTPDFFANPPKIQYKTFFNTSKNNTQ